MTLAVSFPQAKPSGISFAGVQQFFVSMIFLSSCYVIIEPAVSDLCLFACIAMFYRSGLRLTPAIMPLLATLLIYNVAGLVSYIQIPDDIWQSYIYLIGLSYTSISAVFVAAYICAEPAKRYLQIEKAYWISATFGGILGLITYFHIHPFSDVLPTYFQRAVGGYKDPNVYSTWLVFPAASMVQAFLVGRLRPSIVSILSFLIIFAALFLAFSRGAWISAMIAIILIVTLTYLLAPNSSSRSRIAISTFVVFAVLALVMAIMLSIPEIRDIFLDRFTLVKKYDGGETGRFGNQLNAIPMLLRLPFGFGPYQFVNYFGIAPHNTFLNAFASGGWVGGVSFFVLVCSNIYVGIKACLARTPFQPYAIIAFSCLFGLTTQCVQIDMEHWRHFYWTMGLTWGFFAAGFAYIRRPALFGEIAAAWKLKLEPDLAQSHD